MLIRLIALAAATALVLAGCQGSNNRPPYPDEGNSTVNYGEPTDTNTPLPGSGKLLEVKINDQLCTDIKDEGGVRVIRPASNVAGQFTITYTMEESTLGAFKQSELLFYPYASGQPDVSTYYLLEGVFSPNRMVTVCGADGKVRHYTGDGPKDIERMPAGRYRGQLRVEGDDEKDFLFIELLVD